MTATDPSYKLGKQSKSGIAQDKLDQYHKILVEGYPYVRLAQNCKAHEEIHILNQEELNRYRTVYQSRKNCKVVKFVPASGAASRMFKDLFAHMESGKENDASRKFFEKFRQFPFASALTAKMQSPKNIPLNDSLTQVDILKALLLEGGLNYGNLPKGLIQFHQYPDNRARTAFEEHFHEAKLYAATDGKAYLHFTIPDSTSAEVESHLAELAEQLSKELNIEFVVESSLQKPSTDAPAIYAGDYAWVMDDAGELLLRPAGHGALLENLNDIEADLVFIKNIDNVVPDHLKEQTVVYKEALAGMLLEVQAAIFEFLRGMEQGSLNREACNKFFLERFRKNVSSLDDVALRTLLDRPLRVCGMVKNEGEPGGGPFLVDDGNGHTSLQIVEKSQVDTSDEQQLNLLNAASHFNPVDLVVSLRKPSGEKYNLLDYRNPNTGMVVSKTHIGREIHALELPGLWNGSMHHWNTLFVEVPIETFNPVKTVFDLLRPSHQGA